MLDIYRQEAIDHQSRRLDGEVLLGVSPSWAAFSALITAVVLTALVFASVATYARRESVSGLVIPQGGIIRVTSHENGVVSRVDVKEGQIVSEGQILGVVRLGRDATPAGPTAVMRQSAQSQVTAAKARGSAETARFVSAEYRIRHELVALGTKRSQALQNIAIAEDKQELAANELARATKLQTQGYLSNQALDNAKLRVLEAKDDVVTARSALVEIDQAISRLNGEMSEARNQAAATRAISEFDQASAVQNLQAITAADEQLLTAPIAGRVMALPLSQGQAVRENGAVAVLVPVGSKMEVELYAPSRAIGFIKNGQQVRLRYEAFPYQKFGSATGRVSQVSKTIIEPGDAPVGDLKEPVFRILVALDRETLRAYGEEVSIQPGMEVSADVILERRSLLEWLLDPLYAVGKR
jgi:membrane fusion protein